jgi:hypothetical protein
MRLEKLVAHMGGIRNAYKMLIRKPEGRSPLGRPRHRWQYNSKTGFGEIILEEVDWIRLAQDRDRWRAVVNTAMNLHLP